MDEVREPTSRRTFVLAAPAVFTWFLIHESGRADAAEVAHVHRYPVQGRTRARQAHPEPRAGVDASLVLTDEALADADAAVREVFGFVREIPDIADGIACYCGCDQRPGYRSLLTCFYEDGMARGCQICQGEARLAHRRSREGQSLDQIRRAIDARYG